MAVSVWNTVHPKGKRLTLQVNGEICQDPGEDRYLTPWAEAAVYLRNKNKIAIASRHTGHTVFKAFCKIKTTPAAIRRSPKNTLPNTLSFFKSKSTTKPADGETQ